MKARNKMKSKFSKVHVLIFLVKEKYKPSLRIAMISTMKGGKSNRHMRASSIKPSCHITHKCLDGKKTHAKVMSPALKGLATIQNFA